MASAADRPEGGKSPPAGHVGDGHGFHAAHGTLVCHEGIPGTPVLRRRELQGGSGACRSFIPQAERLVLLARLWRALRGLVRVRAWARDAWGTRTRAVEGQLWCLGSFGRLLSVGPAREKGREGTSGRDGAAQATGQQRTLP